MSSSPACSLPSSDSEDVSTCDSSNEESLGAAGDIVSSSDDDRQHTTAQQPMQGSKRLRHSRNWLKNKRKRRRNAGKRYMSDTTKRMVSVLYASCGGMYGCIRAPVGLIVHSLHLGNAKVPHKTVLSLC